MPGYGRRFGSRYGQFVIANTLQTAGNAALEYESRYDLCRCTGFWPRTRHAVARNFYTYNRTEQERRPAIPLYAGSFGAGMISNVWLPGRHNTWAEGAYGLLFQAGIGSGYNFASEFAFDILRKLGIRNPPRTLVSVGFGSVICSGVSRRRLSELRHPAWRNIPYSFFMLSIKA